jgi:alkanesulfonate monooxygenase SsuD/methylene tetrahydromethanopterin reductase-like flavin-dependent oxidoreductase (luciferase family)
MKFGLFQTVQWPEGSQQEQQYRNAIDQCVLADELGFHSLWMTEHHFTRHAITSDNIALLSFIASRTKNIRLGTAVSVLPFHDPVRLAESTALLDHLSNGRLDVGIGRGYQWSEYDGFGLHLDEGNERFEEGLEILLASWKSEMPFSYTGKYHSYNSAFPQPKPVQKPHPPIWHATTSEPGLRRCAQNDWGVLLAQGTTNTAIEKSINLYRTQVNDLSIPLELGKVALARGMYCASSSKLALDTFLRPYEQTLELAARVSAPPTSAIGVKHRNPFHLDSEEGIEKTIICGDPEQCTRAIEKLAAIGIEYIILFVNLGGMKHEHVSQSLRLFAREVIPRFTK